MSAPPATGPYRFCYLRDQQPLSASELDRARVCCDRVEALVTGRADFLDRSGRDPELHLPRGHWDRHNGSLFLGYYTLLKRTPEILNNLRLFSQVYTGYQLLTLSGGAGLPIPTEVPADADERLAVRAAEGDPCLAEYQEATRRLPELLHISAPNRFGEVGWLVEGKLVNPDVMAYLERLALLSDCGVLWDLRRRCRRSGVARRPHILEIGSGYGGLAHYIKALVPEARYFCVDLPESLLFASIYLSTLHSGEHALLTPQDRAPLRLDAPGFTFVPNYLFEDCCAAGLQFDLVINTLSMSEMSADQVRYYCEGAAWLLGAEGVFFEQNHDGRDWGQLDARRLIANRFPFCVPLRPPALRLRQGAAHMWAAHSLPPFAWLPAREILPARPSLLRRLGARFFGRNRLS
jgi:SAM-dependent methyltransferase